jgi:hypothetical protein
MTRSLLHQGMNPARPSFATPRAPAAAAPKPATATADPPADAAPDLTRSGGSLDQVLLHLGWNTWVLRLRHAE